MNTEFETVVGLEVHLQLNTKTKIFSGAPTSFGEDPNTCTTPVCLGLPGSLPVLNHQVLEYGMKVGLALNCSINNYVKFDRKNYFYPDLPKGYQISQFDYPIAKEGYITIKTDEGDKKISIVRAHLEEDAGKLIHDDQTNSTLVDYNRVGTPLIEIVSGPDMRSAQEAYDYLTKLKLILQYLDVSDCDMEKGSLRCDANVSIRPKGETELGTKTELKNMNSFSAVKKALEYEVERQIRMVLAGEKIVQQTLLWNDDKQMTVPMRTKEDAHDYRYFPEPDLVPFTLKDSEIEDVRADLPELPDVKLKRLIETYDLSEYDAQILVQDKTIAAFFEQCAQGYSEYKKIVNWLNVHVLKELNERKCSLQDLSLSVDQLVILIKKVEDGVISNLAGKDVLKFILDEGKSVDQIIEEKGLAQMSDDGELEKIVDQILTENPHVVEQIQAGEQKALGFLVGQAKKKTQGKANPKKVNEIISRRMSNA